MLGRKKSAASKDETFFDKSNKHPAFQKEEKRYFQLNLWLFTESFREGP